MVQDGTGQDATDPQLHFRVLWSKYISSPRAREDESSSSLAKSDELRTATCYRDNIYLSRSYNGYCNVVLIIYVIMHLSVLFSLIYSFLILWPFSSEISISAYVPGWIKVMMTIIGRLREIVLV